MEGLFVSLQKVSKANIFIDSSKFPSHGFILSQISPIELQVLHLIRDPRAVAYSWKRKKVFDPGKDPAGLIQPHSTIRSTIMWDWWNFLIEWLWGREDNYTRVFYEQFIHQPASELRRALATLDGEALRPPPIEDHSVRLGLHHSVSGNPSRFQTGVVKLQLDDEWTRSMTPSERLVINTLSLPLLIRYHYPFW
jgi:hypothetical protein